uniref:Bacterial sugar transferase domain-containing protein n=1 Tax=candidate division WOR-3 bacterium TaxID=2052148 RepID=A0A7C4CBQ5_UNCW3
MSDPAATEVLNQPAVQSRDDASLVILELLFLLLVISLLRMLLAPWSSSLTTVGMVWALIALASYVVGEFESTARANYGLTVRTQAAFALAYVAYGGVHALWSWCETLPVRFWLALWTYLTLLAPLIGLLLRRVLPKRVLFVTDFNLPKEGLLRWWGFDCAETVAIADLPDWLRRHADAVGRVPDFDMIVVDVSDPRTEYLVTGLAQDYFVDFVGIKAFSLAAYLMGPHPKHLASYSLDGAARRMKRVIDLALSVAALALLGPFMLLVALLIKLDSPGPVLYRHRRLGRNVRSFWLLKFRTMYRDADRRLQRILDADPEKKREFETTFKLKDDPRVTRVGRWLRRLSIDELPQFLNVLAGQMSLVGPRPIVEKEIDYYRGYSLLLFRVPPGATGLWQVSGRSETSYARRVELDTRYVREWTLLSDIRIILRTLPAVLSRRGAY